MKTNKEKVHNFWNKYSCGESLYFEGDDQSGFKTHSDHRYRLEGDLIFNFACFNSYAGKDVLEIGVGLGADHLEFAKAGASMWGIDLTSRAIDYTRKRFEIESYCSMLGVGDAENLVFENNKFDLVYSWGVVHHSPNTQKAINEAYRVLKPGGEIRVMIYHKYSIVGYMLWLRYALLTLKPWRSLNYIYSNFLESPGTKAYSVREAKEMFSKFHDLHISTPLNHGDLLESNVGQRHRGFILSVARRLWPRFIIRKFLPNSGLTMLITARK